MITPFDPKSLKDVEKAINKADIGITPSNDGKNIRLVIPPLMPGLFADFEEILTRISQRERTELLPCSFHFPSRRLSL